MRTAALTIGIVGGVFGILSALLALAIGGIARAAGADQTVNILALGLSALGFCLLGFLGAGVSMSKGRLGALLLLVAGIGYAISISWFAIVTTPLFLLAAMLAFFGRTGRSATTPLAEWKDRAMSEAVRPTGRRPT